MSLIGKQNFLPTLAQLSAVMGVLKLAERLKFELRHSYTSSGRQESVAEHTWRMSLMAVFDGTLSGTESRYGQAS